MVKNTIPLFPLWVQYGFLHRAEFLDISDGSEMALRSAFVHPSPFGSKKSSPTAKNSSQWGSQPGTGHCETNPDSGDLISGSGKNL